MSPPLCLLPPKNRPTRFQLGMKMRHEMIVDSVYIWLPVLLAQFEGVKLMACH